MPTDVCTVCSKDIQIQINKGSGLCSEQCRKAAVKA